MKHISKRLTGLTLAAGMMMTGTAWASSADEVNEPGTLPIAKEEITLTIGMEQSVTIEDIETNLQTLFIEEQTGINLEFILYPKDEMMTKIELAMAAGGEDLPDIILGNFEQSVLVNWAEGGFIIPLTEYYDSLYYWGDETLAYIDNYDIDKVREYITSPDGEIYGVYAMSDNLGNQFNGSRLNMYIPWLEELDLDPPTTTDELYNVLKAFKEQDPNGNGEADEIPFSCFTGDAQNWMRRFLMTPFVYTQDSLYTVEDGVIDAAFRQEGWREGLIYCNKLYSEGLMDPAMFTQDQQALTATLSQDPHTIGSYIRISTSNMSGDDPDRYNFWRIEQLTGPDGETRTSVSPAIPTVTAVVTNQCEHPEAAYMMLDFMNSETCSIATQFGFEGVTFEEQDTDAVIEKEKEFWATYPINYPEMFYGESDDNPAKYPARKYNFYEGKSWGTVQNFWWGGIGPFTYSSTNMDWFDRGTDLETEIGQANFVNEYIAAYVLNDAVQYRNDDLAVAGLIYNEEELEVISEYWSEILNYMKESWAAFVTGSMDINDDAAWESYLDTLEAMGLQECVDATQSCYTRMHGGN